MLTLPKRHFSHFADSHGFWGVCVFSTQVVLAVYMTQLVQDHLASMMADGTAA